MVVALVLFPAALLVLAGIAALLSIRGSTLAITAAGVEVHNYRRPVILVPLDRVVRFEANRASGNFSSLQPRTAVLVLTDGSRLPVRSLAAPDAGTGVDALNARIDALRS